MAAAPPAPLDIATSLAACGINHVIGNPTEASRVAIYIFADEFTTAQDLTDADLDSNFKAMAELTHNPLILTPTQRRNVKGFVQWIKDQYRTSGDPTSELYPVANVLDHVRRAKSHAIFVQKSETLTKAAKPKPFTSDMLWSDWYPAFLNFLRSIPGRDGVPLKYICRDNELPIPVNNTNFLEEYVYQAPLAGEAFEVDTSEVHTYIANFIVGNDTAESKILPYEDLTNRRIDYFALKQHYEGVGVLGIDITTADQTLKTLFYSGEKKTHMWWEEFEKRLNTAFVTYNKREGHRVHSNEMKLRNLIDKVNADFLKGTKDNLKVCMNLLPMTLTYDEAISSF